MAGAPVAFVVKSGEVTQEELIAHLESGGVLVAPDKVVFVDAIPKTGTGKFDKKVVRDQYSDLLMGWGCTAPRSRRSAVDDRHHHGSWTMLPDGPKALSHGFDELARR